MFVRSAYKYHIITPKPQITYVGICRQVSTSNVPDMQWAIGIRKCCRYCGSFKFLHNTKKRYHNFLRSAKMCIDRQVKKSGAGFGSLSFLSGRRLRQLLRDLQGQGSVELCESV